MFEFNINQNSSHYWIECLMKVIQTYMHTFVLTTLFVQLVMVKKN